MAKVLKRKKRASLTQRIAALMIFVSFLMITAFTTLQVRNQINTITGYNAYRARLAAAIVKSHLSSSLEQAAPKERESALEQTLVSMRDEKIIENAWIIDKERRKVASTAPEETSPEFTLSEKHMVDTVFEKEFLEQWFYTFVDKERGIIELYIPLLLQDKLEYLAKTSFSLGNVQEALRQVYIPVSFMILAVIFINAILSAVLSKSIINPIKLLNRATKQIAGGKLELRVDIKTGDEIEELGDTFNEMTRALAKMKTRAENANPLTKLPGNVAIREEIETRLREGRKLVIIHSDLDNFKAYNDKYGLGAGDRAIQLTADLFKEAVAKAGNNDDFLGHEGGDDFVVVTSPQKSDDLAHYFIQRFDAEIPKLYNDEDRQRGYIIAKNRQGVICKFPLMSISLAAATNQHRPLVSYIEITNIMPELKEKAKSINGSSYVIDRRKEREEGEPEVS